MKKIALILALTVAACANKPLDPQYRDAKYEIGQAIALYYANASRGTAVQPAQMRAKLVTFRALAEKNDDEQNVRLIDRFDAAVAATARIDCSKSDPRCIELRDAAAPYLIDTDI